jgi:hypothetical protein
LLHPETTLLPLLQDDQHGFAGSDYRLFFECFTGLGIPFWMLWTGGYIAIAHMSQQPVDRVEVIRYTKLLFNNSLNVSSMEYTNTIFGTRAILFGTRIAEKT